MKELSKSYREPQLAPADHCFTILQDHGPQDGGWGPVAVAIPGLSDPRPFVYTGSDPIAINGFAAIARELADGTGKPTRFVKFTNRVDVLVIEGVS